MKPKTTLSNIISILFALSKSDDIKKEEINWFRNELNRWFENLLTF